MAGRVREQINFWQDKTPCWELCHCPEVIKSKCPVSKYILLPCWEIEGTFLKLGGCDDIDKGNNVSICRVCRIYKRYGEGKPIEIKLRGKGLDTYYRSLKEKCKANF